MFVLIQNKSFPFSPVLFFLALLLFSCNSDENAVEPAINSSIEVNLDIEAIMKMINDERVNGTDCGSNEKSSVEKLVWSNELAKAALDHSNDMQVNDYFSHSSQDGRNFQDRVKEAGFTGAARGENIALGYSSEAAVMQGWMESDGHCNNIMNGNSTLIGVARSDEGSYWTMVLGSE